MQRRILAGSLVLLLASGCGTGSLPSDRRASGRPVLPPGVGLDSFDEVGQASWYGRPHHGQRTASGEVFDMNGLTAAHRTLPFGTRVRVTSFDNGRSVEVRINDRGPFARGRVIDLSYAAAQQLGAVRAGIFRVGVTVIKPSERDSTTERSPSGQ